MHTPNKKLYGLITLAIAAWFVSAPIYAQQANFMGNAAPTKLQTDPREAVPRGYIIPSASPLQGGAKISVDIYHASLNGQVSLWLQAAVADGSAADPARRGADMKVFSLKQLSDRVADNPDLYYSHREFEVNYDDLNHQLEALAPNAKNLKIGPGTPLFVYAKWHSNGQPGSWDHQWGGVERGGIVFMPEDPTAPPAAQAKSAGKRPTELDLAFPITGTLTSRYNDPATGAGLKAGGQVRSRVETEGKYQIPVAKYDAVKKALFELANDPAKASVILGKDWTIHAELRYMKKDPHTKQMILDHNGMPTPDPMVDTYYDNDHHDAAKNDMAIRYRWTEGNQSGSWNFKPGLTSMSKEGLVTRTEYGLDTTDDSPKTIEKFADSDNPLNFFKQIRDVLPGAHPSEFLKPAVKVTDTRFKFLLRHANGLAIEVSLDDVTAESLRVPGRTARYIQMEADVEHLATQSLNSATNYVSSLMHQDPTNPGVAQWLQGLGDAAYLAGQPLMHDKTDVLPTSPVREKHAEDFNLAERVTVALRDHVIGKEWMPAPQKYALAAVEVGDVAEAEASRSVKRLKRMVEHQAAAENATDVAGGSALCGSAFASK